jgi:serine/threonine-protein phosphatase 6 regulatory subunit 3
VLVWKASHAFPCSMRFWGWLMLQVLCCEIDAVFSVLLGDPRLLASLFSLLQQPQPLECLLAGYFARVLVCLLMRRAHDLLAYLMV